MTRYTVFVVLLTIASVAFGQEGDEEETIVRCPLPTEQSEKFEALQETARTLNRELCLSFLEDKPAKILQTQNVLLSEFSEQATNTANEAFGEFNFSDLEKPFSRFESAIVAGDGRSRTLPKFVVDQNDSGTLHTFHFSDVANKGSFPSNRNDDCIAKSGGLSCSDYMEDYARALNAYRVAYTSVSAANTQKKVRKLAAQWDAYLEDARSHGFFDVAFTTFMEREHFQGDSLVGPPPRQWIALHPNLVYEHVGNASDGDQDKAALAIEWIGVNWWSEDSWFFGVPIGVSVTSTYTDRPEVDDVGTGLMIHINNSYSIGWTHRGGDDGVYLSLDLLKVVQNNSSVLSRFKNAMAKM